MSLISMVVMSAANAGLAVRVQQRTNGRNNRKDAEARQVTICADFDFSGRKERVRHDLSWGPPCAV